MIDIGRRAEPSCGVARFADVGGADVGGRLAGSRCPVVATDAVSCNAGVGEHGIGERGRRMTGVAFSGRRNVVGRLSDCHGAVVTTAARSGNLLVIDRRGRHKSGGVVACFALVS